MAVSERDQQAIYNFYLEGRSPLPLNLEIEEEFIQRFCSKEILAEYFGCSTADVSVALERPWLRSRPETTSLGRQNGRRAWWESDHSDPLDLVKIYYPAQLAYYQEVSADFLAEEQTRPFVDVEGYLEKAFGPEYVSPSNLVVVDEVLAGITEQLDACGAEYDENLLISLLDQRFNVQR